MRINERILNFITILLGGIAVLSLPLTFFFFETIRPKMVIFDQIPANTEYMMNYVGFGYLFYLMFSVYSFFRILAFWKNVKKTLISFSIMMFINITAFLAVFANITLISDIGKQYKAGLSQPEWIILYLSMAFQFFTAFVLIHANIFRFGKERNEKFIAKDINIFIASQYAGIICSFFGLFLTFLNFFFPRPLWMIRVQINYSMMFLVIPYILVMLYWLFIKMKEKEKVFFDEKQLQDIGRASNFTLFSGILLSFILYLLSCGGLSSMVSVLWFPSIIFVSLLAFSSALLYFIQK